MSIILGGEVAAPHVAGAMALLMGAIPDATVADLESGLGNSAFDLGDPGDDYTSTKRSPDAHVARLLSRLRRIP